jgi:hypothetical protein
VRSRVTAPVTYKLIRNHLRNIEIKVSYSICILDDSLVHLAGIFHNLYLKVQETEDDLYMGDKGWKFYVHGASETPTLGVQTHGTSLYPGQGRDLRLDLKMVRRFKDKNWQTIFISKSRSESDIFHSPNVSSRF